MQVQLKGRNLVKYGLRNEQSNEHTDERQMNTSSTRLAEWPLKVCPSEWYNWHVIRPERQMRRPLCVS